jgi:hypothetical protein
MSRSRAPSPAPFAWRRLLALAATLVAGGLVGCGDDTTNAGPVPPPGPPVLRIERVASAGNGSYERDALDCVPPGRDGDQTLVVEVGERARNGVDLLNWTFRPFGGCGITPQCGLLVVRVYASGSSAPAVQAVSVSADVPIAFGREGLGPGSYTVEAELVDDTGAPFQIDGGAFQDSIELTLGEDCVPRPDAGGAPDGGIDSGPGAPDAEAGLPDGGPPGEAGSVDAASDGGIAEAGGDARDASASDAQALDASMAGDADASADATADASSDAPTGG